MDFNDFQNFFGELSNQAEKEFGGDSDFLRDRINKLKEDAPENVSYEIIYSIAIRKFKSSTRYENSEYS